MSVDFDPFAKFDTPAMESQLDSVDFDQFLTSLNDAGFNYDSPTDLTPQGDDADGVDTEPSETAEDDKPTPPSVESVRIGDKDVPLDEVRLLYEFGKTLRETGIAPVESPVQLVPPTQASEEPPTPEEPPDYIDQDSETQMGLWKELQATRREIAATRQTADDAIGQIKLTQQEQQVVTGIEQFKSLHPDLNEEEMTMLITLATPTADHFVRTAPNPVEGIKKALHIAGLDFQPTRDRILGIAPTTTPKKSSTQRKRALGSLAGPSTSAPRNPAARPRPTTDKEAVSDFAKELAQSFGSNGSLN